MKILIVTPVFWPENFRINELAEKFVEKGHTVTVLTSIPNYPEGKFFDGYGLFKKRKEVYKGVRIYRIPVIPRGNGSNIRLSLNFLSYVFFGIFSSLFLIRNKYDLIFCSSSPMTVAIPAIFIKKIKKIPLCIWVLDLWPETVAIAGNLKTEVIPKMLMPIVKFIYNASDLILVTSKGFKSSIMGKGIPESKIKYFPQWAEEVFESRVTTSTNHSHLMPDGFIVMFAGNIGVAQDFNSIIDAAIELKHHENIHWVILGKGSRESFLKENIKKYDLERNFHLIGRFPIDDMPEFFSYADALLITLKKEYIFSITVPAKVQAYLAAGRPILTMSDGQASTIVNEAKAGLTSKSGEAKTLANNILNMSRLKQSDLDGMGDNGYRYFEKNFKSDVLLNDLEQTFNSLLK